MPHQKGTKTVVQNRKAFHDYFVEERYECGIELFGTEVKSMRAGKVSLKESWAQVRNREIWVEGMHISPYDQGSYFNKDPLRPKRLLLHQSEIRETVIQTISVVNVNQPYIHGLPYSFSMVRIPCNTSQTMVNV